MLLAQLPGAPSAFAVVGFSEVRQLEIDREGLGDLISLPRVHLRDETLCLCPIRPALATELGWLQACLRC